MQLVLVEYAIFIVMRALFSFLILVSIPAFGDFQTNELRLINPPKWLKKTKVEKVTNQIQSKLEWKIRKVPIYWHSSMSTYLKAHSLGPMAAAVTIKSRKQTAIHIGPNVDKSDYQEILGHELVHVIFYQKYKGSIPKWLEEGFANFLSRKTKVNYKWLSTQKLPQDVTQMRHPFKGQNIPATLHYKLSQALVEMLDGKCNLDNLLRLSVQKKLLTYIRNTCRIKDINQAFRGWVYEQSK